MLGLRWNGQKAGLAGWLTGLVIAGLSFGLNWEVLWVSQLKGLLLSLNVLWVFWAALYLYNCVDRLGGVAAIAQSLANAVGDRGLLLIVLAWVFSAVIEGVAGYGLPAAIVAPMLIALNVAPVTAVAAAAIGHAWATTFGNMGVVFGTLTAVTEMDALELAPYTGLLLGVACLLTGLAAAALLGQLKRWPAVVLIAAAMSSVQYLCVVQGLAPLGAFFAALVGVGLGVLLGRRKTASLSPQPIDRPALLSAGLTYGLVIALMVVTTMLTPLKAFLGQVVWAGSFPEVSTLSGFNTPAGTGQVFRPLLHPGNLILLGTLTGYFILRRKGWMPAGAWRGVLKKTSQTAIPTSLGVLSMVGLSTLMEHTGMTMLLAEGLARGMGGAFPLVSAWVGMLGSFATGSNNNSNVLFAPLQKSTALLLSIPPALLIAAQTVGGALGSMIAPAKMIVAVSTSEMKGRDFEVLRYTLPIGLGIALIIGLIAWLLSLGAG